MKTSWFIGLCGLIAVPCAASAQEVQTYSYDVHGRLTAVTRVKAGATQTTTYGLDDVDNRTVRDVSAPVSGFSSVEPMTSSQTAYSNVRGTDLVIEADPNPPAVAAPGAAHAATPSTQD